MFLKPPHLIVLKYSIWLFLHCCILAAADGNMLHKSSPQQMKTYDLIQAQLYISGSNAAFFQEEQNRGKPNWEHLNDELHVLITVEDTENRAKLKIERAVDEVKKLLTVVSDLYNPVWDSVPRVSSTFYGFYTGTVLQIFNWRNLFDCYHETWRGLYFSSA